MIQIRERMCEVRTGDTIFEDRNGDSIVALVEGINPMAKTITIVDVEDGSLFKKTMSFDDFIVFWNQNELSIMAKESYLTEMLESIMTLIPEDKKQEE